MSAAGINRGSERKRLRLALLLFLLALAAPTLILIKQAYSQLKWEAFHQHRLLAEELAARIDRRLNDLIHAEEARAFTDYAFLVVAGDPAANFLQRSPLSDYPPSADIPGLLGYFQIDAEEVFSTPLLPPSDTEAATYGISGAQLAERKSLQARLRQILSENRLVQKKKPAVETAATASREQAERRERMAAPDPAGGAAESRGPADIDESEAPQQQDFYIPYESVAAAPPGATHAESYMPGSAPAARESETDKTMQAQAAFDRLSAAESRSLPRPDSRKTDELRVEDLKLSDVYEKKARAEARYQSGNISELPQRAARKERSILPEPVMQESAPVTPDAPERPTVKINIFESELDPFEASLLDSGHFILFRKVWRNDRRYIQGLLLEHEPFINGVIGSAFRETALSHASGLAVAWGGEVLASYASAGSGSRSGGAEPGGALLYRTQLSTPFTGLELVFNISRLPAGPGGKVIGWSAVIIMFVLCGGTWLMYRLGLRQIDLVNQQQDFVSAVSHELKTPLTSIRMYGEMLKQGWVDESKRKTYYDFIFDESERLTRLINNVLQLARLTRNDYAINARPVSIGELLDTIRSKITSQIERAGFALDLRADARTRQAKIEVDTDIFTQIIINLVDNAVKFSAKAQTRAVDIEARLQDDGNAVFSVRDYGPGIPKNQLTRIFRLFYRSGNELTRETAGTGIGLALVRQLTLAMHGRVDALNRQPGAEFRLSFSALSATDAAADDHHS